MKKRMALGVWVFVLAAGCAGPEANGPASQSGAFIRDTATVLSVDPALGQVLLNLHGKQVRAFWQTEVALAQPGNISQMDATGIRQPVGQYKEPLAKPETFDANPGDTIAFLGMWTGDQIFLRSVALTK